MARSRSTRPLRSLRVQQSPRAVPPSKVGSHCGGRCEQMHPLGQSEVCWHGILQNPEQLPPGSHRGCQQTSPDTQSVAVSRPPRTFDFPPQPPQPASKTVATTVATHLWFGFDTRLHSKSIHFPPCTYHYRCMPPTH